MKDDATPAGHPITFRVIEADALPQHGDAIEEIYAARLTGVIVRGAFPEASRAAAVERMTSAALAPAWSSPNAGMRGGEIRVIGDAATPTFTFLRGPTPGYYAENAARFAERTRLIFGDAQPTDALGGLLSALYGGRPAAPPTFDEKLSWAPCNYRALDPGQQIYTHHDDHYGLEVYRHLPRNLARETILSYFVTLQAPDAGGELVVYGLWGSDPNPPMLPTRFIDTAALEKGYLKETVELGDGDLIVFDAGRYVHRVTPVEGARPRLTVGGFLTVDVEGTHLAYWS